MKIYLDTIGCRLNQSEIETLARQFRAAGHEIVADATEADLAVVNTCTVTAQAAADSRQTIRRMTRLGAGQVIATGCWATLDPQAAADLPGVTRVVPNADKDTLVPDLLGLPPEGFDLEPLAREPLPGLRARTRAFIKVQDGCDNRCAFCITTVARGAARSRPAVDVLAEVRAALKGGAQEIVLTGVHLGAWGQELGQQLRDLVKRLILETDVPRLRLSSLEPWDLDEAFFALWYDPRMMPHLHLPLQSGCAQTLRRMARQTTPESYARLAAAAREAIPNLALTTDVIAGFPGESENEFAESLAFVEAMDFAGGHVFTYSARPGTAAARMKDQVPVPERKERTRRLREHFEAAARAYRAAFLSQTMPVLWESALQAGPDGWRMEGLTPNYIRVEALTDGLRWNQVDPVRLTGVTETGLEGEIRSGT